MCVCAGGMFEKDVCIDMWLLDGYIDGWISSYDCICGDSFQFRAVEFVVDSASPCNYWIIA